MRKFWLIIGYIIVMTAVLLIVYHLASNLEKYATTF